MTENSRKLVILDLALALIVFALFGVASLTFHGRHADPEFIQVESDTISDNGVEIYTIPSNHESALHHVSMETTSGSTTLLPESISEIPSNSNSGEISDP